MKAREKEGGADKKLMCPNIVVMINGSTIFPLSCQTFRGTSLLLSPQVCFVNFRGLPERHYFRLNFSPNTGDTHFIRFWTYICLTKKRRNQHFVKLPQCSWETVAATQKQAPEPKRQKTKNWWVVVIKADFSHLFWMLFVLGIKPHKF